MAKHNTKIVGEQIETGVTGDGLEWSSDAVMGIDLKANDGLEIDTGEITVDYDNITIGIVGNALAVKALGIDTAQLAADAVDGTKIADDSIDSEHYVDASIDTAHIALDAIDGTLIADDAVNSEHIANSAIDLAHMSVNSVDSDQYVDGSIDLIHMSDNSVDTPELVAESVTEPKLDAMDAPNDGEFLAWNTANSQFEWKDMEGENVTESDFNFEDESATTDGIVTAFNLTNKPLVSTCQVFLNGLLQQEGVGKDYVLDVNAKTVTFGTAPQSTDLLLIYYVEDDA